MKLSQLITTCSSLWKQHFFFFTKKRNTLSHELSSSSLWGLVMPDNGGFYLVATWRLLPSYFSLHHVLMTLGALLKCQIHLLLHTTEKSNQLMWCAPNSPRWLPHTPVLGPAITRWGPVPHWIFLITVDWQCCRPSLSQIVLRAKHLGCAIKAQSAMISLWISPFIKHANSPWDATTV